MTLSNAELSRYARQILLDDWDIDAQNNLKNSHVTVVGAGGLGAFCLPVLVRAGVRSVHIIDFDHIDDSNLQRQALFFDKDIGKQKSQTAHQALLAHNPFCLLSHSNIKITPDNANTALLAYRPNLILDCTDNFLVRDIINNTCVTFDIPLLSASAVGEVGQLALFEPAKTGCYACVFGHDTNQETSSCVNSGVLASTVAVMGGLQANVALKFLGQKVNPLSGKLLLWQGTTMQIKHLNFTKNPDCPVCQITKKNKDNTHS